MKKIYSLLILIIFSFTGCEEVIDIKVPSGEPKLVIDAFFEVFFNKQPVTSNTVVKLSLTADYFVQGNPPVTNATVYVTNLMTSAVIDFTDNNQNGNYLPNNIFIPQDDIEYELTVIYNSQTYKATHKKIKTSTINDVVQGDETLFTGNETQIKVSFNDEITRQDYYRFSFDFGLYRALEDRFINGSDYEFSFFYKEDDLDLPSAATIKISGITKDYFTYFRVLLNQSSQTGGGPFQTIPSTLLGNIVNQNNKENFALGYFLIADTDTKEVLLTQKDN